MDCGIVVCEFVLQSRYYVHFRANTLRKDMNPLILTAMGVAYIYILDKYWHNDKRRIKDEGRKTQEGRRKKTSLQLYFPLTLLQGFERVVQGLHVRGCWRPNINFIFWPHCYDRHVVSFLFSWCWGQLYRAFRGPPRSGVAFPTTSGLYCLEVCWQLLRGFSEGPLGRVWLSLPHLVSSCLEFYWQLLWHPKLNWVK